MVNAINAALSGFLAATQQINANANNIANAESTQTIENGVPVNKPYVPQKVAQSSAPAGGVTTSLQPVNPPSLALNAPGNPAADANGITQFPNVDQAQQLVGTNIALYDAQANLNVIKVQDKLLQSVLNIVS